VSERFGREIPERIRENPIVRVPTHLVLLGRVLGLLSGVNRSLDARIDLARTIFPYVMGLRRSE
jgi:predicted unusual protein kinase regulating ubiquinone biosynthesis (AarF/ABC1/UbiB family)